MTDGGSAFQPGQAGPAPAFEPGTGPAPNTVPGGDVVPAAPGASLVTRRQPALTPPPQPAGPRVISPMPVPAREWGGAKAADLDYVRSATPTDVKIVVGALIVTAVVAAIMVGILLSSVLVAVIAAVVLLLGLSGFLWMTRL